MGHKEHLLDQLFVLYFDSWVVKNCYCFYNSTKELNHLPRKLLVSCLKNTRRLWRIVQNYCWVFRDWWQRSASKKVAGSAYYRAILLFRNKCSSFLFQSLNIADGRHIPGCPLFLSREPSKQPRECSHLLSWPNTTTWYMYMTSEVTETSREFLYSNVLKL